VSQALERVRQAARQRKTEQFTALFHHLSIPMLRAAFFALKRAAAPGVDGLRWQDCETDLDRRIEDLHTRVHRGAHRAQPSRRRHIPKPDGRQRPLAIAAVEDKIVQRATVAVLNAIYEEEFLGISYGFRPGRGPHDAPRVMCGWPPACKGFSRVGSGSSLAVMCPACGRGRWPQALMGSVDRGPIKPAGSHLPHDP
jgi:hypothetical protein